MSAGALGASVDRWVGAALIAATVVGVGWFTLRVGAILLDDPVEVGEPIPDVSGRTLDGASFDLADLKGRVVLLDFFSLHCVGCIGATPLHNRLQARFADRGVVVIGVNQDPDELGAVADYVRARPVEYDVVVDPEGAIADAFGVRALPFDVLVGADGTVRSRHRGGATERALADAIEAALDAGPTAER